MAVNESITKQDLIEMEERFARIIEKYAHVKVEPSAKRGGIKKEKTIKGRNQ